VQRAAEALASRHEVRVVSVDSGRTFRPAGYGVRTVPLGSGGGQPVRHLRFLAALLSEARAWRPHVVHAHDFFMAYPGLLAAKVAGARLVYDAHELIVPEPGIPLSARDRFWYRLERRAVGRAALVIAANRHRAEIMREHYGLRSTPVVVANIPPLPPAAPPAEEVLARYPILRRRRPDSVRLVYQGDISLSRGVWELGKSLAELPERFDLLIVGGGPDLERLRRRVAASGLGERILFTGRIPREDLHPLLTTCDIGLISYPQEGQNNIWCAPNKLYEYAQAGLPTFARENPVLREQMEQWGVGIAGDQVATSIRAIAAELDRFRSRLPAFLEGNRWEAEADRLLRAYDHALGTGGAGDGAAVHAAAQAPEYAVPHDD
jgi:glycosyltransferase involved in cell wall biosynthesis